MSRGDLRRSGWRGVSLIAITYVYFLIFAQFAFLKRLAVLGIADAHLKAVMAAMVFGGVLFSLLTPRLKWIPSPGLRLRIAFLACAIAAFLTLLPLTLAMAIAVSFLIGCGLGLLTVTLVTYLRLWMGDGNLLLKVGVGTGLGYLICNIPPFFSASGLSQSMTAGVLCLLGIVVAQESQENQKQAASLSLQEGISHPAQTTSFLRSLACFTALVWLDSAAFFIIQNTPDLKAGTWQGTVHLSINGILHFAAALGSVWLLRRLGLSRVLPLAFFALAIACLLLLDPAQALIASAFYPVGVSLYSVALVAYPSLLTTAVSAEERGKQAGWIYAIAGWFGSGLGIGMGQNLGHVPPAFVLAAGLLVLWPGLVWLLRVRRLELGAVALVMLVAFGINQVITADHRTPLSASAVKQGAVERGAVERGRRVYISEGCIHCHSQYVRSNTSSDVLMWGPVLSIAELRREHPPLIGNRRQGPDLSNIGSRRSPLWLKAHFYDPSEVSHASFMPSYQYLFRDERGNDLVAYMQSLHGADTTQHLQEEAIWHPAASTFTHFSVPDTVKTGQALFDAHCATCHQTSGITRRTWQASFKTLPPDLSLGPYRHLDPQASPGELTDRLAHIIKFGFPGTDMPGHEYLSDQTIFSISIFLEQKIQKNTSSQSSSQFRNIVAGEGR